MSKQLIEAILALKDRVDVVEQNTASINQINQENLTTLVEGLTILVRRLEAVESKVDQLTAPVIVDNDGVISEVAGALRTEFNTLKANITKEVDTLKGWFHTHLNDHEINGGRTKMLSGAELTKFLDGDQP
ncbi:hypothetical protein JKG68_20910 [Microvirga aerilata]|uniref:Uncharacterized protein n=1 Tax=Microvirga aerilata TaxID=670292 RepID=A0A937CY29_9HYPH|nr:hypothetical protein [Microvirga aerilata]MBL0406423.1 hypothetical protein [Microvirga aerilata]